MVQACEQGLERGKKGYHSVSYSGQPDTSGKPTSKT